MKTYEGMRGESRAIVTVIADGVRKELDPRFEIRNHSPTGFEWGYGGSGPAQLSLALLADHFEDDFKAQKIYQDFKFKIIVRFDQGEWKLTTDDINLAIRDLMRGREHNG